MEKERKGMKVLSVSLPAYLYIKAKRWFRYKQMEKLAAAGDVCGRAGKQKVAGFEKEKVRKQKMAVGGVHWKTKAAGIRRVNEPYRSVGDPMPKDGVR